MAKYCPFCVSRIDEGNFCPYCDGAQSYHPKPHHLRPGTLLKNKYLVGRVLGEGGFGITYVGRDLTLDMKVAIKEYFPNGMANRVTQSAMQLSLVDWSFSETFQRGKEEFIREAQTIAKMDKENAVVTVRDFFESNNSAYIVMEFVEGEDLRSLIRKNQKPMTQEELLPLLEPVFSALDELHAIGLIHRDISPDNLMIEDGRARLIDFGCARETVSGAGDSAAVLKHSFSPVEQYANENMGPWTDVYAMAATIYYCLTGRLAPRATDRAVKDTLVPPTALGVKLKPKQEKALLKALAIRPEDRFQSMRDFGNELFLHQNKGRRIAIAACVLAVLAIAAFVIFRPSEEVIIQESEGDPDYQILTLDDETLTEENRERIEQMTAELEETILQRKKETYSYHYVMPFTNRTDMDFEDLRFEIQFFDAEGVNIGTTWSDTVPLQAGDSKEIMFYAPDNGTGEYAEVQATAGLEHVGLKTGRVPVPIKEEAEERISVLLRDALPQTLQYQSWSSQATYTVTNFSYETLTYSTNVECRISGSYDSGTGEMNGSIRYRVLNQNGDEIDSGSIYLPKLKPEERFANVRFTIEPGDAKNVILVLEDYT